jgi:mannosyltransferase
VALPIVALTAVAAVLRFLALGDQGFWFDEGNTALLVHLRPGGMLGLIPHNESTPPLYYCLLWVWARIFGFGEAGLRSFSAIAGVACVPVLYLAAERLASRRSAVIVAALSAFNPLLIWYSQEARSYSLLVFFSSLTLLGFALVRKQSSGRRCAFWAVACLLALFTHYYAVLIVAPEAVVLLIAYRRDRGFQLALGAVVLGGLALLPYAIDQNATGHASWIGKASLSRRLGQVVPQFVIGFGGPWNSVLEPLAVALVAGSAAVLLVSAWPRSRPPVLSALGGRDEAAELAGGRVALAIALAGLALNLLLIAAGVDDLLSRNLLALWPAAAVAVGCALATPRLRFPGLAATAALCAIGLAVTVDFETNRNLQRPDWRVVARVLDPPRGAQPAASERLIVLQHYRNLLPLSLYMPRLRFLFAPSATVSEIDFISLAAPPSGGFCWWGSACNLWSSRSQRRYPISGFRIASRRRVDQFTIVRLVSSHPQLVSAAAVSAALRTTRLQNDGLLYQLPAAARSPQP